ncbi:MAG: hypothetical protein O9333_02140 [Beijerinckiaceae bacterium]|nr:hypothetical protein [Beijerinckiaceae bacterium]
MIDVKATISVIMSLSIPITIFCGLRNRSMVGKGIGWQFIRFIVLSISIPTAAILALNGSLTGEAATIIAGAMGYAFGKSEPQSSKQKSDQHAKREQ